MAQPAQAQLPDPWAVDHAPTIEPSDQFLSSLTAAMRRVADDARETSLADARAAVAAKIAAMRAAASARSEELRARADQDVLGIEEWSRAEIVRIEAETQRKIEHRRAQLTEQLDDHDQRSAEAIAALEKQVEHYEGELALFFAQLGEISDPDTFIAAARRMPRLPQGEGEGERRDRRSSDAEAAPANESRLRSLGIEHPAEAAATDGEVLPTNGVHADPDSEPVAEPMNAATEPQPEPAAAAPESAAAPAPEAVLSDATTVVAAVGLGSFGAVTSFKNALEKTVGVSAVRLSLGTSGEFVYSVTHDPGLDLEPAVTAAQPAAALHRGDDGVLHLNAGKRR